MSPVLFPYSLIVYFYGLNSQRPVSPFPSPAHALCLIGLVVLSAQFGRWYSLLHFRRRKENPLKTPPSSLLSSLSLCARASSGLIPRAELEPRFIFSPFVPHSRFWAFACRTLLFQTHVRSICTVLLNPTNHAGFSRVEFLADPFVWRVPILSVCLPVGARNKTPAQARVSSGARDHRTVGVKCGR